MDCYPCARKDGQHAGLNDLPHSTISIRFKFLRPVDFDSIENAVRCQDQVFCDVHDDSNANQKASSRFEI